MLERLTNHNVQRFSKEALTKFRLAVAEYFAPSKAPLEALTKFVQNPYIIDPHVPESSGMSQGLADLIRARLGISPDNMFIVNPSYVDPRNIEATHILNRTDARPQDLVQYLKDNPEARFAPIIPDPKDRSDTANFILNNYPEKYPDWLENVQEIFSKHNLARIARDIHQNNLQEFLELCQTLGLSDEKQVELLKNLKRVLPNSEIVDDHENPIADLIDKAIKIGCQPTT